MLFVFYALVVILGILSMGFQLLGSRLLSPHFGSSVIVWAWLISTFLASFSLGSMFGGWVSNRPPDARVGWQLGSAVLAAAGLAFTSFGGKALLARTELLPESLGLFASCVGLFLIPVTMLSSFTPQCVQFIAARGTSPGAASGTIYGVSTVGNIGGVMLTAFFLIPNWPVPILLNIWLGVAVCSLAALIALLRKIPTLTS